MRAACYAQKKGKVKKQQGKVNKNCKPLKKRAGDGSNDVIQPYAMQYYAVPHFALQQYSMPSRTQQYGMPSRTQQYGMHLQQNISQQNISQQNVSQQYGMHPQQNISQQNGMHPQQNVLQNTTEQQMQNIQIPNAEQKYDILMKIQTKFIDIIKPRIKSNTIDTNEYTMSSTLKTIATNNKTNLKKTQIKQTVWTNNISELFSIIEHCEHLRKGYYENKIDNNMIKQVYVFDNSIELRKKLKESVEELRKYKPNIKELIDNFDKNVYDNLPNNLKLSENILYQFKRGFGLKDVLQHPHRPYNSDYKIININIQDTLNILNRAGEAIKKNVDTSDKSKKSKSFLLLEQANQFNHLVKKMNYFIENLCSIYSHVRLNAIMNEQYTPPSQRQRHNITEQATQHNSKGNSLHDNREHNQRNHADNSTQNHREHFDQPIRNETYKQYQGVNYNSQYEPYSNIGTAATITISNTEGGKRKTARKLTPKSNKNPIIKKSKPKPYESVRSRLNKKYVNYM